MDATDFAVCYVVNCVQRSGVDPWDYGFSIQGTPRTRVTGWCLTVLAERHIEQFDIHFPCLPILRVRPWLLVRVARHVPLTSNMIFAFLCLVRAMIRDCPGCRQSRAALSATSLLLHRLPCINHCFGYIRSPTHGWSEAIWRCLDE
ncbi:MAG: NS7c [Bat faecal coronavirus]|nr:MAG: NS7c [Bat faecal coronavirus]